MMRALPLLVLAAACASPRASAPADQSPAAVVGTPTPCNVPIADGPSDWRLVERSGFTFCLPKTWQELGPRSWRGEGSINWVQGGESRQPVATGTVTFSGGGIPPAAPPIRTERFSEAIGGRQASLWHTEVDSKHFTGVRWSSPALLLQGEARDGAQARLQLAIYRTVRFR